MGEPKSYESCVVVKLTAKKIAKSERGTFKNISENTLGIYIVLQRHSILKNKKRLLIILQSLTFFVSKPGGGEENRTPVQTYSPKAFYMLILFYCVRKQLGTNNRLLP